MRISELLKAEQTGFISLAELLITLSQYNDGCEISVAAQFLRLKLITAPNGTRPNWEKVRWSLTGPEIVQSRSKDSNAVISLLESLCSADCDAFFSDDKFLLAYFYGFDRAEITTFIASYGVHIKGADAVVLEQSRVESDIDPADLLDELSAANMALRNEAPPPEKPLGTTERNNLLKLVIGMAVGGYRYDPRALKSTAPKEIADDLAELGISITDETVRKYLKQAGAVLPAKPMQT